MKRKYTYGFTLVEISIVLVIIALIIAGILVGRDLIRAAEIRGAISQKERFDAATNTFRIKYNCLPGDCATATNFGFANNGNGDREIGRTDDIVEGQGYSPLPAPWIEMGEYWVQLSSANLIDGSYTLASPDPTIAVLGVSSPKSKTGMGYWWLSSQRIINTAPTVWVTNPPAGKHIFWLTGSLGSAVAGAATLIPIDAYAMDSKMDDGKPFSGNVMASDNFSNPGPTQIDMDGVAEAIAGPAGSGKCVNEDTTPPEYNFTADTNTDCANDSVNCHLCGLVVGASF